MVAITGGARPRSISASVSLAEVALFYAFVLSVIWFGGRFRPTVLLAALIVIALCVLSNRWHGDTLERVGLSWKGFWPSLKEAGAVALPFLAPLYWMAFRRGFEGDWNVWFSVLGYPFWGFAQEYALLGFIANRLEDGFATRRRMVPWISGALFSAVHFPNPVLMALTFLSGVIFTIVFFRHRNLAALALIHALVGIGITFAFGDIQGIMSIGPGYESRIGTLTR